MKPKLAIGILLAAFLAGCGGSGDTSVGVGAASNVTFSPGASYNGSSDLLKGGLSTVTTTGGNTVVTISQGARTLAITLPGTSLSTGDTFRLGLSGAVAAYTEVRSKDTTVYTWAAISGKVTITSAGSGSTASLKLEGLKFQAAIIIEGNLADGSVTLDGTVGGVPVTTGGGIGGSANLSFSDLVETNADLAGFTNPTIAYAVVNGTGTLTASLTSGAEDRGLAVVLSSDVKAGDTITFGEDLTSAQATFVQSTGDGAKTWIATSGTLNVISRTTSQARVQFVNTKFTPGPSGTNQATGSFVVNGSVSRE